MRDKIISLLSNYNLDFNPLLEQFEGRINGIYFWGYFWSHSFVCFYGETFKCKIVTSIDELRSFIKDNFENGKV